MILFSSLLLCCLLGQITAETVTACSDTTDCADDECCFHPEVLTFFKRNVLPFDAKSGKCQKLTKNGRSCNVRYSCGCEKPATCQFTTYGMVGIGNAIQKRVSTMAVCRTLLYGSPFEPHMLAHFGPQYVGKK